MTGLCCGIKSNSRDVAGGQEAQTPRSQSRGSRFGPWAGNQIPQAASKSSHATTKESESAAKTRCSQINE